MKSRLLLLFALCLLAAGRPADPCEPASPVTADGANLDAAQAQLLALLRQHKPRFTAAEVEAARAAIDRCNTASADALNGIEVEKSGLSLRLSELLRYGDVVKLRERIETLRKNRESALQELDRNLGSIRQVGLFAVLLEKVDIYAAQAALRAQAQAALSPRAAADLNGVFVQRTTETADLQSVKDIVRAYAGGEAAVEQVLFDRTNFEPGKDYYLYFAKISVRPLKKSPAGQAAPVANASVFNLDVDKNYQSALSARGVTGAHLAEINTRAGTHLDFTRRENDDAARRRELILTQGQDQLRRTDRDIEDAERDLRARAGKIETICRELGLPYSPANPDQSASAAAQKLREQIAALETRWNQTKEQEIQYADTRVTIQTGPAEDFAAEAVKLARKLEQDYGKVQKTEEITRVEDFSVTELRQSREVELYRRLRRLWVYPVGEADGTFRLYVFGAFNIAGRKEAGGSLTPGREPAVPEHLVRIAGGTFEMGDVMGDGEYNNETVHRVTVSSFLLGKTEVSFDEYDAYCNATGKSKPSDQGWGRGKRPVINVSWLDAVEYCNWRSKQENLTPCYTVNGDAVTCNWSANGYRLPTEAEWEYAARQGGQKVRFGNGKNVADPSEINFDATASYKKTYSKAGEYRQKTTPVASFGPNSLGLYDMSGNVWEWCWDWYAEYLSAVQTDPKGPDSGVRRLLRGGSWGSYPVSVRAAFRGYNTPSNRYFNYGFRLARAAGGQ